MALALYRKYRPRTFAEVIGQEHVTEPLSQALRSGRLNHAYLFSGPRGCGKTSSARILARSLNCEHGPTPEPCGTCDSCRSLSGDGAGSIDVIEIDAASHGGVDDARELREKAFFAPASSRFKIYVIDEAHMVSSAGFNALLKLVEEPPEYVKFIFATTEPEKVLGTIKSRTHHYPFRLIPPKVLRPYLEQLCEAEGVQVEPAVFPLVVRAGGGSARDSLSVLDQLIAGAGPDGVSYAGAAALLGVTDSALIDEMCDALAAGDGAAAYATVDRVAEAGHDPRRFASDLLERLRDLIVLQQVPDAATKGLIDGPDDQIERMAAQAQRLGPGTLSRCADIVNDGLVEMRGTTAPRLLLELICARMLLPGVDDTTGGLLQRLERMERRLTLAGTDAPLAAADSAPASAPATVRTQPPAAPAAAAVTQAGTAGEPAAPGAQPGVAAARAAAAGAGARGAASGSTGARGAAAANGGDQGTTGTPAGGSTGVDTARRPVPASAVMPDPATPEPPRPGSVKPGVLDAAAVRRIWPEVVGKVGRKSKKVAAWAREATVREVDGQTLVLTFRYPFHAQALSNEPDLLIDSLYEELGERWQIRCEVAGERGGTSPAPARSAAPAGSAGPRAAAGPGTDSGAGRPDGDSSSAARSGGEVTGSGRSGGDVSGSSRSGDGPAAGRSGNSASATGEDDEGWPEPARPGGSAPTAAAGNGDSADDWPEAARPGGRPAPPDATPAPGAPAGHEGAPDGRAGQSGTPDAPAAQAGAPGARVGQVGVPGGPAAQAGAPGGRAGQVGVPAGRNGAPGGSHSAAGAGPKSSVPPRQVPATNGNGSTGGARVSSAIAAARAAAAGRGARTAQATRQTADAEFAGEPPYDPDFDGPVRG
ncbi:DNA polymerase III subunit gamma and tau, partial [Micromonospora craterilacus]